MLSARLRKSIVRAAILGVCGIGALGFAAMPVHAGNAVGPGRNSHEGLNAIWKIIAPEPRLLTTDGKAPPLLPAARRVYEDNVAARKAGNLSFDSTTRCMPPGMPRILSMSPFRIVVQDHVVGFVFQWNHAYRPVYINGTRTNNNEETHYYGEAIGHWDGDTLAVDSVFFSDSTLLDEATPNSEALHLTERYRLTDGGKVLVDDITVDDPKTFSAPWSAELRFARQSATAVLKEDVCTDRLNLVPTLSGAMPRSQAEHAGLYSPSKMGGPNWSGKPSDRLPLSTFLPQLEGDKNLIYRPVPIDEKRWYPPPADPRDFAGPWKPDPELKLIKPTSGERQDGLAPYTPEAESILRYRMSMERRVTPVSKAVLYCRPIGPVNELVYPFNLQILQAKDVILEVFEEWHDVRAIHLNQQQPTSPTPTYMGHSVGHWEGNTLVVDTVGFNDKTWLDFEGSPHGRKLHVIERMRKIDDGKTLEDLITVEDPEYYTRPFTIRRLLHWRPDMRMPDFTCEEALRARIVDGLMLQ